MKMRFSYLADSAKGILLAAVSFSLVLSAFPLPVANAAGQPLFSVTLLAPTSNPLRRQWAAIITNSLQAVNIDAKLVYVSFGVLLNTILGCPVGCPTPTYDKGGFDLNFVGFGGGTTLPDFGTQNVVTYRNEGPGDVPPIGQDYYFWKNTTFNSLADQYSGAFDPNVRIQLGQQMIRIVAQERPAFVLFYPASVYGYSTSLLPWGKTTAITATNVGVDYAHWKLTSGNTFNVAETGDINAINVLPTGAQNSFYDRFLYGPVIAGVEEVDGRNLNYFNALANSITSSSDHLTWTVNFKAHNFQDGVAVTADDYLFANMAGLIDAVGSVGEGTLQGIVGLQAQFSFLNGTTRYVNNGTYSTTQPASWKATSAWKSLTATSFQFTLPTAYVFTDPLVTGGGALPMHIYEKVAFAKWSTGFLSGFTGSSGGLSANRVTVTWSTARYGGNGSYAWVFGPVGDGPYMYRGYDTVAEVGTLTKFPGYWNASGLQALGQFGASVIHVDHIAGKDAAIAAWSNGQVNFLDSNFQFNAADVTTLKGLGTVAIVTDPSAGWQEMGANMNNPIFGTGTATPLGQSKPSQAYAAGRLVRQAFSYLIPRAYIVANLLGGLANIGVTQFCTCYTAYYPSNIQADPYDPVKAKAFLAAAGYNTGVAPATQGGTVTLPVAAPITIPVPAGTPVTVNVPTFLLGNTLTISGKFATDPVKAIASQGYAVVLQQSTDGGTTWTPVTFAFTTVGSGAYSVSYEPTQTGSLQFRVLFSGIPLTYFQVNGISDAAAILAQLPTAVGGGSPKTRAANTTNVQVGPVSSLTVGTLADLVTALVTALQASSTAQATQLTTSLNSAVSSLTNSINSLSSSSTQAINTLTSNSATKSDVSTINANLTTLTDVSYAALAVALVLGLLAIGLSMRKRT